MSLEIKKPCYFCGGKYEKIVMSKEMKQYDLSTAIINKIGTDEIFFAQSLVYSWCYMW